MTQKMVIAPHLTVTELEARYRRAGDPVARSQWQIVWLLAGGTPTAEVARVTGYSVRWIQELARRYRAGPAAIGDRRHGNPGAAPLLTPSQQEQLRLALAGPAPDGGLWTCRHVAAWMSQVLGRPVGAQRGWEWMRRVGFPRNAPDRARPAPIRWRRRTPPRHARPQAWQRAVGTALPARLRR